MRLASDVAPAPSFSSLNVTAPLTEVAGFGRALETCLGGRRLLEDGAQGVDRRCFCRPLPDWSYVQNELKRRGVTLLSLWEGANTANFPKLGTCSRRETHLVGWGSWTRIEQFVSRRPLKVARLLKSLRPA